VDITPAPTWDGEGIADGEAANKGLMLKIEGTEGMKAPDREEGRRMSLEALVETYERRMRELRRVLEAGSDGKST